MKCRNPECLAEITPGALFCEKCHTPVLSKCPECGTFLPANGKVKFCPDCGKMVSEMEMEIEKPIIYPDPPLGDNDGPQGPKGETVNDSIRKKIKLTSKTWAMIVHPIICTLYVLILIIELIKGANSFRSSTDAASFIGSGVTLLMLGQLLKPLLIFMSIGTIFSIVGLLFQKPWAYLTAAIIQSIGILAGWAVELMSIVFLLINILLVTLGYLAYYQIHKYGPIDKGLSQSKET